MSIIGMAKDVKLVDSFLLAIGKTDRGSDVEKNVVLDFIRHIRAAQKKEQVESPVNNTQQPHTAICNEADCFMWDNNCKKCSCAYINAVLGKQQ